MEKKLLILADKYSVGYDEIDNQHKKLVEMINDLHASFKQGAANKVIENILSEMIQYTDYHFKTEEKYFEEYNYSDKETHIYEHKTFVEQVSKFYNDYKNGSVTVTYDVLSFLRDWLVNHIQGSDKKYTAEFKDKGLEIKL